MFVAFEGIDGSGKTTLSNLVCERLRAGGRNVVHARERGVLGSAVARRVRELTRDARLLEMSSRTELFLNLARETQQLDEIVRPALASGALVIADRSLHSLLALAIAGRGLPASDVRPAVDAGAAGTWPDLVVLVDVDPDLARLRKRVGKIVDGRERDAESRKGLSGAGLQFRIARHLRGEAERDPGRWIVARNEGRPLAALAEEVAAEIASRLGGGAAPRSLGAARAARNVAVDLDPSPERLAVRFHAAVGPLAETEPALAAFLLAGIPGAAEHALRMALATRVPGLVARSLHRLDDPASSALRRALARAVPADVAEGLGIERTPEAALLRAELLDRAPGPVLAGLAGDGSESAWAMRERGLALGALEAVLEGLAGVDDARAWDLRDDGLARGLWPAVARSLAGLAGARADAAREAIAAHDRLAAVRSTAGVDGPVARALREALFPSAAKRVLRSLAGVDAPYAWALRERALSSTKEALDSVDDMDAPRAWALRDAGVELWPATAVSSLGPLVATERGRDVVRRALRVAPWSVAVLRNAHAVTARVQAAARADAARARDGGAGAAAPRVEEPCTI